MANKKRTVLKRKKASATGPRSAAQYFARPEIFQDNWNRVTHVVSKMRAGKVSLRQAASENDIDPRTVLRLGGSALRKRPNGRYAAKASDRLLRVLVMPTNEGPQQIAVRDSRQASQLAKYSDALQRYLQTGDSTA